jgi:hypothetical protein
MRASLERLFEARFELEGYDAASARLGRLEDPVEGGWIRLLSGVRWSRDRERHAAHLAGFIVEQLEAGNLTYLDWRVLRGLEGLAKRLWVLFGVPDLQAFRHRRRGGRAAARPADAPRAWRHNQARAHARRLIIRAGQDYRCR